MLLLLLLALNVDGLIGRSEGRGRGGGERSTSRTLQHSLHIIDSLWRKRREEILPSFFLLFLLPRVNPASTDPERGNFAVGRLWVAEWEGGREREREREREKDEREKED